MRATKKLTAVAIRGAKPQKKPFKLFDGGGLFLLVNPNGSKYWRFRYRYPGLNGKPVEKLISLGVYPDVSLSGAREKLAEKKTQLQAGNDPSSVRQAKKASRSADNQFQSVALRWIDGQRAIWTEKHAQQVENTLTADIFPRIGHLPIHEISGQDILTAVKLIEGRGAHETASRVLQRCRAVFTFAIAEGLVATNPAAALRPALIPQKKRNFPALKPEEMPEFLAALSRFDGSRVNGIALRMLMLTATRTSELRRAQWPEFDLDQRLWLVPADRMKSKREHLVPLSNQVVDLLCELQPITGTSPLLFPSRSNWHEPISNNTILFAIYRLGFKGRMCGHGFRSTFSTWANELHNPQTEQQMFSVDAIERQLAHIEKNKVRGAYNRAEYLPERKRLMQTWADFLDAKEAVSHSEALIAVGHG